MGSKTQKKNKKITFIDLFAGIGAVIIGGLAYAALGGLSNTIAAAVVGGLAGGCLGLFF
jgi:outer membrane lipoprotein SlyB